MHRGAHREQARGCALISHASSERGHDPLDFNPITSNFSSWFSEEKFNPSGFRFYEVMSHERKYSFKKMEIYNLPSVCKSRFTQMLLLGQDKLTREKKSSPQYYTFICLLLGISF